LEVGAVKVSDLCEKSRKEVVCWMPFAPSTLMSSLTLILLVVKLFNTIQQSQLATAEAEAEAKASRGTGKPSLPTPSLSRKDKGKKNDHKNDIPGREKQSAADKDTFFDMIRSGGIVSKV
jgi:hypothetical protein